MKNMLDILVGGVMYWVCGWALAHGSGGTAFSGGGNFFTKNLPAEMYPIFFFDYMFASTAITIVSGSIAERCPILAYMVYSVVISGKSNLQIVNQILSFCFCCGLCSKFYGIFCSIRLGLSNLCALALGVE